MSGPDEQPRAKLPPLPPTSGVMGHASSLSTAAPQVMINVPGPAPASKDGPAEVLNAVAAVLWPLVVAFALIIFRSQIVSLAQRIRKGKAFGAEAEFDQAELQTLNREAIRASEEAPPTAPTTDSVDEHATSPVPRYDVRSNVLEEAARSPRLGLMLLSAEIDKLARRVAASAGHHGRATVRDQINLWSSQLPPHTSAAYRLFSDARNRIVHGKSASEQEILSAIDSGLLLYSALASISIEQNVVKYPDVAIFADEACTTPLEGKALIIETTHNNVITERIFPSTLTHYVPGMRLTWEWNMSRVWGSAWYRHPETNLVQPAWSSAAEFVGKDLDQI